MKALNSECTLFYSFYKARRNKKKKQVCQQEKDQLRGVQVGALERRGQMLRKEMAVETVNEWLLETLGGRCVEMLTRPWLMTTRLP